MKKPLIIIIVLLVVIVGGYFVYDKALDKDSDKDKSVTLDAEKEATHLSKVGEAEGAYWKRGGWFFWNQVEKEQGTYDWELFDDRIQSLHEGGFAYIFPVVFPYANWDQEVCHPEDKYISKFDEKKGGTVRVGAPCDMEAYVTFLAAMVERYDGDGKDDMPKLMYPIKYWEIMNEPMMDEEDFPDLETSFFVGTAAEYLEILKRSYQTIKKEDPEAQVLHAGLSGFMQKDQENWEPFFAANPGNYFDIANLHTIDTSPMREDLNVIRFKEYLAKHNIQDKPLWITETEIGGLDRKANMSIDAFNQTLSRGTVFALAKGADKIFYISSWEYWDNDIDSKQAQQVYENLVQQVNSFDSVETIKEEYSINTEHEEGATSTVGQYKFINGNKAVYVLWGKDVLPAEITGTVTVTNIFGKSQTMEAKDITLTDEPVFVTL